MAMVIEPINQVVISEHVGQAFSPADIVSVAHPPPTPTSSSSTVGTEACARRFRAPWAAPPAAPASDTDDDQSCDAAWSLVRRQLNDASATVRQLAGAAGPEPHEPSVATPVAKDRPRPPSPPVTASAHSMPRSRRMTHTSDSSIASTGRFLSPRAAPAPTAWSQPAAAAGGEGPRSAEFWRRRVARHSARPREASSRFAPGVQCGTDADSSVPAYGQSVPHTPTASLAGTASDSLWRQPASRSDQTDACPPLPDMSTPPAPPRPQSEGGWQQQAMPEQPGGHSGAPTDESVSFRTCCTNSAPPQTPSGSGQFGRRWDGQSAESQLLFRPVSGHAYDSRCGVLQDVTVEAVASEPQCKVRFPNGYTCWVWRADLTGRKSDGGSRFEQLPQQPHSRQAVRIEPLPETPRQARSQIVADTKTSPVGCRSPRITPTRKLPVAQGPHVAPPTASEHRHRLRTLRRVEPPARESGLPATPRGSEPIPMPPHTPHLAGPPIARLM
eukprot:TRINITY_DN23852_c0_g1_i1.p1 TRINITY_DN23852_c0_g1~~TRINITY_DN23852_c0_g1_i1.p1  ORF type:complete len:499 (+),score=15.97 TRINITY_DN23852_c0_g1_i1:55-1551(+)